MMRFLNRFFSKEKTNRTIRVLTWGGFGDALLITPAIAALKKKTPDSKIVVYCEHPLFKELFRHNPDIDILGAIYGYKRTYYTILCDIGLFKFYRPDFNQFFPTRSYDKSGPEFIGEIMEVEVVDLKIRAYTTMEEDSEAKGILDRYENPVIINPATEGAKNKMWPHENWEEVIRKVDATFIQLGTINDMVLKGAVDFRGRTSIRQTMAIMKNAMGYVGIDSFLNHLANAFDTPAVVIFGPTSPAIWGHDNAINIWKGKQVSCAPCVDILWEQTCPYDRMCMKLVDVREVVDAVNAHILGTNATRDRASTLTCMSS